MSRDIKANEKNYKIMSQVGGGSIAIGVIILVSGIVCGVLSIVNGARLLKNKSDLMF